MESKLILELKKPARKAGGDRYESKSGMVFYIPQDISRSSGSPPAKLKMIISDIKDE